MSQEEDKAFVQAVGRKVRSIRKKQGLSQAQLAFEAGLARNLIVSIEKGHVNTTVKTLFHLSRVLNVHPSVLLQPDE